MDSFRFTGEDTTGPQKGRRAPEKRGRGAAPRCQRTHGKQLERSNFDPLRIGSTTKRDCPQQFTVWTPDSHVSFMPDGLNRYIYGVDTHCPLHIISSMVRLGRG